jgi:hypothetical protein
MFNLDDFDKIFYDYGMTGEELSFLEESLIREAHNATRNVHDQVDILRKINQEQLSLPMNEVEKNTKLANKFNKTVSEIRSSHLMLGLIQVGLYELKDVISYSQNKKYVEEKNRKNYQ